jgi:hypothetical protein
MLMTPKEQVQFLEGELTLRLLACKDEAQGEALRHLVMQCHDATRKINLRSTMVRLLQLLCTYDYAFSIITTDNVDEIRTDAPLNVVEAFIQNCHLKLSVESEGENQVIREAI